MAVAGLPAGDEIVRRLGKVVTDCDHFFEIVIYELKQSATSAGGWPGASRGGRDSAHWYPLVKVNLIGQNSGHAACFLV
jgi:hypothetical protein